MNKPNAVDSLFYDGSVIRKLESLALDYSKVKETVSDGKVMLDCVSQDLSQKIRSHEQEFHKDINVLRGGNPLNLEMKTSKARAVKDKAMSSLVDDRTPHQKKKAKKKVIKEEEVEIKPAQFVDSSECYIPFPSKS